MAQPANTDRLLGAIEAGGTKFVLATGTADGTIHARHSIATTDPEATLAMARDWFFTQPAVAAMGIASFGPVELDRNSPNWGHITDTPKPGWSDCDLAGFFARELGVPIGFDTDVNGAALGEFRFGAGRGAQGMAYITVGTGIGGGLIVGDSVVHGAGHPEMGHFYPRRPLQDIDFAGNCPFHGDCLEGLASGPSILARWGKTLSQLPQDHEAHDLVAGYLAQACHTLFACCAIERVVMGGGVMKTPGLAQRVQDLTQKAGGNYLPGRDRQSVVTPQLGDDSGIIGALLLAEKALG
ncbi:ROK family protein [Aurantiacibacter rhizosphaerae]|uniref:fructokinase n=1 Tax=Aurantiacibacter rhizosphaerae TaxID=2691582 RepID=A0A844XF75_9SPHN|nr:ROK family protein [Aurantiacibacter rhizosphaerae]MWV29251.1 ROK family protein [Aurantiacibacter rhizosphaerae]